MHCASDFLPSHFVVVAGTDLNTSDIAYMFSSEMLINSTSLQALPGKKLYSVFNFKKLYIHILFVLQFEYF